MLVELLLLGARALAAEPMCEFVDQSWRAQEATLRFPDSDVAFAVATARGLDSTRVTATLARSDDWVRLHSTFQAPDVVVSGDIDTEADAVLSLVGDPLVLGDAVTMLPGGRVAPGPAEPGHVLVRPEARARQSVTAPSTKVVPCDRITLAWQASPTHAASMAAAGLPPDAPMRTVRKGLPLRGAPGGKTTGAFLPDPDGRIVYIGEERHGWTFVAWPEKGTVWHGWAETSRLEPAPGLLGGVMGRSFDPRPGPRRVCDADVALWASAGEGPQQVGTVRAGTPMVVVRTEGSQWIVEFPEGWLEPVPGATLRIPVDGVGCHEVPAG